MGTLLVLLMAGGAPIFAATVSNATDASDAPSASSGAWETYLVFEKACAECHGGHLAKPKGKLGYILDLRRLVDEAYVRPGLPERSDLFTSLVSEDPEMRMPPPDSDGPKPTAAEIEVVRAWIAAGAHVSAEPPPADPQDAPGAASEQERMPMLQVIGRLHPLVVHFPIALILCAAGVELAFFFRPSIAWAPGMVRGCVWLGAAGAAVAASFGWLNALHEGYDGGTVDMHRWLGLATVALSVSILAIHQFATRSDRGRGVLLLTLLVAAAVVAAAGHTGGLLAYGEDYLW